MVEICGCSISKTPNSTAVVSSNVTYDGSALSCISFSAGDLNELLDAVNSSICLLQTAISTLTLTSDEVITSGNIVTGCSAVISTETLTQSLNKILSQLCGLQTAVTDLDTDGMVTVDLTVPNCLNITNGMSLTDALKAIISELCPVYPFVHSLDIYDTYQHPIGNYAKALPVVTDSSGMAVAKVDIAATNYFVNNTNVTKVGEEITLVDTKDNYIYLDYTDSFNYAVEDVNIGATAPTVTGAIVCYVTTGAGSVAAITNVITLTPITNTLIADSAIKARNLYSDIAGLGLINNAVTNALDVKVDGSTIEINADTVRVKADGITKTHINADVAGDGLVQNGTGALDVNVAKSITTSVDAVELVGDDASPALSSYYGTNKSGTKGFHDMPIIETDWIEILPADILTIWTTPIILVAAPTEDYYISVFKVEGFLLIDTVPYDNGIDKLVVQYDSLGNDLYEFANTFIESASGYFCEASLSAGERIIKEGDALILTTTSANPTAGNGTLYVKVYYKMQGIPV
jgi:hypothetical protein